MILYLGIFIKIVSTLFLGMMTVLSHSASFIASKPQSLPIVIFALIALFPAQVSSLFRAIIMAAL